MSGPAQAARYGDADGRGWNDGPARVEKCPESGIWEVIGSPSTTAPIARGDTMPGSACSVRGDVLRANQEDDAFSKRVADYQAPLARADCLGFFGVADGAPLRSRDFTSPISDPHTHLSVFRRMRRCWPCRRCFAGVLRGLDRHAWVRRAEDGFNSLQSGVIHSDKLNGLGPLRHTSYVLDSYIAHSRAIAHNPHH